VQARAAPAFGTDLGRPIVMTTTGRRDPGIAVGVWIIATVAVLFLLRAAGQLLIPIVLAVLISYIFEPGVAWLSDHRVPRLAGTTVLMLAVLALTGWGAYSLRDEVAQTIESLPETARRAREMVMSRTDDGLGANIQQAAGELRGEPAPSADGGQQRARPTATTGQSSGKPSAGATDTSTAPDQEPSPQQGSPGGMGQGVVGVVQRGVGSVLALAGHITVIVFLVFFLLLSGEHVRARIIEVAGPDDDRRRTAARIIDDINAQVQRFLVVRLVTAVIVGGLTWAVLTWMGVQHAAVWGILAGVFNSIPYFGPIIVTGGLLIVGLVQGDGLSQALQMAGAALLITSLEGWLLTPPLMGKAERMSALAVFLGLLLWTWIWGAWGTILAVPMLVIIKSVADHVPRLKAISRLMAP
jgi:predicted PurR-regulated permease PerM